MPSGQEFSKDFKQLAFSIIEFVESEKSGPSIPLYNVNERLQAMLHISDRSITRLKKEMRQLKIEAENAIRSRRTSSISSSSSTMSISITPSSPKKYLAGRPKIQLTEMEQDTIRLIFKWEGLSYRIQYVACIPEPRCKFSQTITNNSTSTNETYRV